MNKPYAEIVREERHFVAILFHLLFYKENMVRFLKYVEEVVNNQVDGNKDETSNKYRYKLGHENKANMYFEYAYLRDMWDEILPANGKKRRSSRWSSAVKSNNTVKKNEIADELAQYNLKKVEVILKCLGVVGGNSAKYTELKKILNDKGLIVKDPIEHPTSFNTFCPGREDKEGSIHVESPGNWSLKKIMNKIDSSIGAEQDRAELCVGLCMLKWAFNAKLDLVVAIGEGSEDQCLIGIEAKIESSSSKYPSDNKEEKDWFHKWVNRLDDKSDKRVYFDMEKDRKTNEKIGLDQVGLQLYVLNTVSGGRSNYVVPLELTEEGNKASWAKLFLEGEYVMKCPSDNNSDDEVGNHSDEYVESVRKRICHYVNPNTKW